MDWIVDVRISGIPATVRVTHWIRDRMSGLVDADWEVCDQRGRPAPWLEAKVTDQDHEAIWESILEDWRRGKH